MYINLINCFCAHIYQKEVYLYTDSQTYRLDEICSCVVNILKQNSLYTFVVKELSCMQKISIDESKRLIKEILSVVSYFFVLSERPNSVKITGKYEKCYPSVVQISLTTRCIHQCIHCFRNCTSMGTDIPYNKVLELIDRLSMECDMIEFTGGEPFLYCKILELVEKYENRTIFNVTTSGMNIENYPISKIKKFNLIQISLQGSNSKIHDNFVKCQGSFKKVTENIKYLCKNNVNVSVSRSVASVDETELKKFIELCISLGVHQIVIGIILPLGRAKTNCCFTDINEYKKLDNFLKWARQEYTVVKISHIDEFTDAVEDNGYIFRCTGGRLNWYVNELGDVFPCSFFSFNEFKIGNLFQDSFLIEKLLEHNQYVCFNENLKKQYSSILSKYNNKGLEINKLCANMNIV